MKISVEEFDHARLEAIEDGKRIERERIIRLLDDELIKCECEDPLRHVAKKIREKKHE